MSNTFLLLDEPETHLHPQAQEFLKDELIQISKAGESNVVIYATHSNYMIDKLHIDRCFRVAKTEDGRTEVVQFKKRTSTYSEVNYEVFDIASTEYHNELYGYLEENDKPQLDALPKKLSWKNKKSGQTEKVSLQTYIRHSIHHPENRENKNVTEKELRQSIEELRSVRAALNS